MFSIAKKLYPVLAIFLTTTAASNKTDTSIDLSFQTSATITNSLSLEYVLCIYYPIWFKKNQIDIQALINFGNEINPIT